MNVLLLVAERLSAERFAAAKAGRIPTLNCDALAGAIRATWHGKADILDRSAAEKSGNWFVKLVYRFAGAASAVALLGFLHCRHYDAVFSQSSDIGRRLALLLALLPKRPRHVCQAFCVTAGHPRLWFGLVRVQRQIDTIIFFSRQQYTAARDDLRLPPAKLVLLENGIVDTDFFRPMREPAENDRQLCAVGREHRDYPTLVAAVAALPQLTLKLDSGSPASHQADSAAPLVLPPNVESCRLPMGGVWQIYAESAVVAVPLYPNLVDAGLSTVLEAMAMAKAVVTTRSADGTYGGRPIVDGETALLVDIGDVDGWRAALTRLFADPALRRRLGENARRWIERHAARRDALAIIMGALRGAAAGNIAPAARLASETGEGAPTA